MTPEWYRRRARPREGASARLPHASVASDAFGPWSSGKLSRLSPSAARANASGVNRSPVPAGASEAAPDHEGAAPSPRPAAAAVLLVAGMHRSGTSALARAVNLLGAEIPGPVVPAFLGNDLGHWEPQAVVDLHDAMLRSARTNVNSVFGPPRAWFDGAEAGKFVDAVAKLMAAPVAAGGLVLVKDPRMGLFLPVWRRALERLGAEPRVVLPFRRPLEVAASLQRRQRLAYPDAVWPVGRGVLLWLRYVLGAERDSRGLARAFVAYDRLLAGPADELGRLERELGVAWPRPEALATAVASLRPEHRHARAAEDAPSGSPLADRVWEELLRACEGGASTELFDAASDELDAAALAFQGYVEALELRLGERPALRTEYVDFLRRPPPDTPPSAPPGAALIDAARVEPDADRRAELLDEARADAVALAADRYEAELLVDGLLAAARRLEGVHEAERETARREVGAERERLEGKTASAIAAARDEVAGRIAELQSDAEAAAARANASRAELASARLRLADMARALEAAQAQALRAREIEAALRASTSWRITAPLRRLAGLRRP